MGVIMTKVGLHQMDPPTLFENTSFIFYIGMVRWSPFLSFSILVPIYSDGEICNESGIQWPQTVPVDGF